MKLTALALLAALNTSPEAEKDIACASLASFAETVMTIRQGGGALAKLLEITADEPILRAITTTAYEMPRFSTPKYQKRAIENFRDEVHLSCLKLD